MRRTNSKNQGSSHNRGRNNDNRGSGKPSRSGGPADRSERSDRPGRSKFSGRGPSPSAGRTSNAPHSRSPHAPTGPRGRSTSQAHGALAGRPGGRIVVGIHACRETIAVRPRAIDQVFLTKGFERNHELKYFSDWAEHRNVRIVETHDQQMALWAHSHQGVAIDVRETPTATLENLAELPESSHPTLIALDEISDPHNLGAVLRSAWLLGAKAVLVPDLRSASLTPAATKVASGGAEHVPVVKIGNLPQALKQLQESGYWVYGLAGESSEELTRTQFHEKAVIVTGAEDKGLRSTVRSVCDALVSIPQTNAEASFNASVATSVVLYERMRQLKK
jgi:23S rRNA (guanosine2251-2'-O)-methyltransferase